MANNPKKVKDPTEVALSAIQEALNISDVSSDSSRSASRSDALPIAPPPPPPQNLDEPMFSQRPGTDFDPRPSSDMSVFEPIEEPRANSRRPANDDRETIGQVLQAIQKGRPARNVYTLATLFAGIWLIGAIILTISFLPSLQA